MIELRWLLTSTQEPSTFCEPVETADGATIFVRLQYRENVSMLVDEPAWLEIPVVSALTAAPRLVQINGGRRGH